MSSITNSLLFRSPFQTPKRRFLSSKIGFREKKPISNNKFPIFCRFNGNDEEFSENLRAYVENRKNKTAMKNVQPQWSILPSISPENIFSGEVGSSFPANLQISKTVNGSGIPISARIIKMKTKLTSNEQEISPISLHSSIVKSISSVLLMIDELLNLISNYGDLQEASITASKEMTDSFIQLLNKICVKSPDLFMLILNLVAEFIVFSCSGYGNRNSESAELKRSEFGFGKGSSGEDTCRKERLCFDKTRSYYERLILRDPNNSMILSNYAQFLYQNMNEYDRAEEMFRQAVRAEPPDAEALSRYASFMLHQRKDIEAAEENFLAAIEIDPSSTHRSNYALFLFNTGSLGTCYPLNPSA